MLRSLIFVKKTSNEVVQNSTNKKENNSNIPVTNAFLKWWQDRKKNVKKQDISGIIMFPNFIWMLIFLIIFGLVIVLLGIGLQVSSDNQNYALVRYDNTCSGISSWTVTFKLSNDIENAALYYRVDGFYGNHKNYVKSKSTSQLRGNTYSDGKCTPIEKNSDIGSPTSIVTGSLLTSSNYAYPCGLIAKYFFTDTFSIKDSSGNAVTLDETNIALNIDKDTRFKNTDNKSQQWLDFTNQHFMNWERVETFPWFDKLYAKVSTKLKAGELYTVTIQNNYVYSKFDIKKSIVVSSTNGLGDNPGLPIIFLTMGGFILGFLVPALLILKFN